MQRLIAWLCLALALVESGIASHGFVLCIEPGGDVHVEAALEAARCGGCQAPGEFGDFSEKRSASSSEACPCVDVDLNSSSDTSRARAGAARLQLEWLAATVATQAAANGNASLTPVSDALRYGGAAVASPTLLGSVVLRV